MKKKLPSSVLSKDKYNHHSKDTSTNFQAKEKQVSAYT